MTVLLVELSIVAEVERWMVYRRQRNITSHTYDMDKAASVYRTALRFFPDAVALLSELEERNG